MTSRVYYGLDIAKFVMSLFIVSIHTDAEKSFSGLFLDFFTTIQCISVPCFFTISAFLFFNRKVNLLHYIRRLSVLYIFYFILFFPVILYQHDYFDTNFLLGIKDFFLDLFLRSTFPGSWFISSQIIGTILVVFLIRVLKGYTIIPAAIIYLYFTYIEYLPIRFCVVYDLYETYVPSLIPGTPSSLLSLPRSIFWISLGYYLSKYPVDNLCKNMKFMILSIFILVLILQMFITEIKLQIILTTLICIIAINIESKPNYIYKYLRNLSVLFYFWQFICIAAFKRIMPTTFNGGVFEWFIVLIVLYCLSFTIIKLSEIKSFRFLKMSF